MLCNYCLEKIPQGEEVRELAAGDAIIKSVILILRSTVQSVANSV